MQQSRRRSSKSSRGDKSATSGLPKSALCLLTALASKTECASDPADADMLVAADLAIWRGDGTIAITQVGFAHLVRHELARNGAADPFLAQHRAVVQTGGPADTRVSIDAMESPLAWLARRKGREGRPLIDPQQLQAGERLRQDFTRAQLMPRTTSNWTAAVARDGRGGSGVAAFTDAVLAARQCVRHALDAAGPEFAGLLIDVCCFLKRLDDLERERGWPARSAKVVLQLGLDRLARHYGYGAVASGKVRTPMRTWLAEDATFVVE